MAPLSDNAPDYLGFGYGVVLALGGMMGASRGSVVSLLMGMLGGAFAAYGSRLVTEDQNNAYISLAVSSLLTLVMGARYFKSRKILPAGIVFFLSAIMGVYYTLLQNNMITLETIPFQRSFAEL